MSQKLWKIEILKKVKRSFLQKSKNFKNENFDFITLAYSLGPWEIITKTSGKKIQIVEKLKKVEILKNP